MLLFFSWRTRWFLFILKTNLRVLFLFLFLFVDGFYVSSDLISRFFYLFSITQLHFKCSGSSQPPPSTHDKHVDPHTGVHLEEVTATIHRDLVDEYFGKGPFKCECHAWSSRGVVKSQAATVNIACKLQILSFKNVIQSNQNPTKAEKT